MNEVNDYDLEEAIREEDSDFLGNLEEVIQEEFDKGARPREVGEVLTSIAFQLCEYEENHD